MRESTVPKFDLKQAMMLVPFKDERDHKTILNQTGTIHQAVTCEAGKVTCDFRLENKQQKEHKNK